MCRGDACAGDVVVAPMCGVTTGSHHATAPSLSDRVQPLQELIDRLDPTVVLPGARASRSGSRSGYISHLQSLNALRRSYAHSALAYVGSCRAVSGVADVLFNAGSTAGRTPSAALRNLHAAANAIYAHVRTPGWMINPIATAHPGYIHSVRAAATEILDLLFRDPELARRIRTFLDSGSGSGAQDALVIRAVAEVLQRAIEAVRHTECEGELVALLEPSLEEEEGLFKPIVETLVAANGFLGASGTLVDIIVTLATRNIVSAVDRAWRCREVFSHHRSQLVDFVGLEGEDLRDFDHALHEGNREHAEHALQHHFGGAGPRSIGALVAVLDLLLKFGEMGEHADFQHQLDVLGGVVEATHAVGEAAVAIARALTGSRTALQGVGELMHACGGAVSVVVAVVTIVDSMAEVAEARERGDTVGLVIHGMSYGSGVLMLLALLEVPGANIAAGVIGLGVFAAETYRERTTTAAQGLFESLVVSLRRPSPWNRNPLDAVTGMHEMTVTLERAMTDMSWSTIDVRSYAFPPQVSGSIIYAWRSQLRGLGISREVAEEIVIDPNQLSAGVEHDVEAFHASLAAAHPHA